MAHKYEIYKDRAGNFRVRFKYNNEVMWSSEGYSSKASALNLIESIKKNVQAALVTDLEHETRDLVGRLERAPIPASDRIVRLDHNSQQFKEFEKAFIQLKESMERSNDFGDLSPEAVDVAKNEILQFDAERKRQWIRPAHIWQVAKSTLLWIVKQAAGAVIGQLALAALAALAIFVGIAF